MDAYEKERQTIIDELTKIYPYPKQWFSERSTPQLLAMYHKTAKREAPQKSPTKTASAIRKVEDGLHWIKTDAGVWEIEYD